MPNYHKNLESEKISRLQVAFIAAFPEKSTLEFKSYLSPLYHIEIIETLDEVQSFVIYQTIIDELEIIQVGTIPSARGKGLALRLISMLARTSKDYGIVKIFLEVAANNASALKLYEKAGFTEYSRRREYYKVKTPLGITPIDAVLMHKIV